MWDQRGFQRLQCSKKGMRAGEVAQRLEALAVLAEDRDSVPSTHSVAT